MTVENTVGVPAISGATDQRAAWFLGARVHIRVGGETSGGQLAVLHHEGPRGYGSPVHRHAVDDEMFLVLDGEISVLVDGRFHHAGPGASVFLPRQRAHAFVVRSDRARFLTVHTPAGFEEFVMSAGSPVSEDESAVPGPTPEELAAIAGRYGIEILGPPPSADDAEAQEN